MIRLLNAVMADIERRATQQGKTKYLEPLIRMAFGPMTEAFKNSPHKPTYENPAPITVDVFLDMHAGLIALMRVTNADDLIRWARPNMITHAEDPDFRRAIAVEAIREGMDYVDVTPELYGRVIDHRADEMLKQVGFS